jgi:GTP cyclohydrolase I
METLGTAAQKLVRPVRHGEADNGEAESAIGRVLEHLGFDIQSDGLKETPHRWVKAMKELTRGYDDDPEAILSTSFEGGGYDQLVLLKDIPFVSICEHHLLPIIGKAHIGYVPVERVVGLSKLARLVDCFARRFQIQERMTKQIADAIEKTLKPLAVGVMIEASHACMTVRGVAKPDARMITSDVRGLFRPGPQVNEQTATAGAAARAEFFALIHGRGAA